MEKVKFDGDSKIFVLSADIPAAAVAGGGGLAEGTVLEIESVCYVLSTLEATQAGVLSIPNCEPFPYAKGDFLPILSATCKGRSRPVAIGALMRSDRGAESPGSQVTVGTETGIWNKHITTLGDLIGATVRVTKLRTRDVGGTNPQRIADYTLTK